MSASNYSSGRLDHPSGQMTAPRIIPFRDFLGPKDVICGRGKGFDDTEGNRNFRAIMKSYSNEYAATARADKHAILTKVLKYVKAQQFRFVKGKNDNWRFLNDDEIRRKIAHALRDAHSDRRQHKAAGNFMKTKRATSTGSASSKATKRSNNSIASRQKVQEPQERVVSNPLSVSNHFDAVQVKETQYFQSNIFSTLLAEIRQSKAALLQKQAPVEPASRVPPAVSLHDSVQSSIADRIKELEETFTHTQARKSTLVSNRFLESQDTGAHCDTESVQFDAVEDILDGFEDEADEYLGEEYEAFFSQEFEPKVSDEDEDETMIEEV